MTFDISPMQSAVSPIALLAGLQGPAASDDFAALLDREALPEEIAEPGEPAGEKTETLASAAPLPTNEATAAPAVAALAIAHADALVATLAPTPERTETPAEPRIAIPAQTALPFAARPVARRDAPASLPKEEPEEEDRPAVKHEGDDAAPRAPAVVMTLPETVGAHRPADDGVVSPEPVAIASAKRTPSPMKMEETTEPARLPGKAEHEIGRILRGERPELAKPAGIEAKPVPVETASPRRPVHIDMPVSTQPGPVPKAVPVRASKVAEIALGLADRLPDPTVAAIQRQLADIPAAKPEAAAPVVTAPASPIDIIVDRQLDLVRNEQWLGELAHDIASTSGDNNRLSFRLMPHQLGRLDVDVTRSHNGLSLAIHTESDSAQAILSAAQPRLADEIRAQGLKLADTQMFSGDARHSPGQDSTPRPAPLIETFTTFTETVDEPEPEQRDGRYA